MRASPSLVALAAAAALTAASARASAPPIGPIPKPTVTTLATTKGSLVSIALPTRTGYDWRIARSPDASIVREVTEGNVGSTVVLVFRAAGRGHTSILVAETRGERARAFRAVSYDIRVA
jgi:hypothetical protein